MKLELRDIVIVGLIIYALFFSGSKTVINPTVKEIETRIEDSIVFVDRIKEVVRVDKIYLDTLYVNRYNTTDTVKIIQIQDTIIVKQKEVIIRQDTIINTQENVILAKDTIINLKEVKIKKKNKDLFKLTLVALGAGVIAILK
jgi:hypothetical protein